MMKMNDILQNKNTVRDKLNRIKKRLYPLIAGLSNHQILKTLRNVKK